MDARRRMKPLNQRQWVTQFPAAQPAAGSFSSRAGSPLPALQVHQGQLGGARGMPSRGKEPGAWETRIL